MAIVGTFFAWAAAQPVFVQIPIAIGLMYAVLGVIGIIIWAATFPHY